MLRGREGGGERWAVERQTAQGPRLVCQGEGLPELRGLALLLSGFVAYDPDRLGVQRRCFVEAITLPCLALQPQGLTKPQGCTSSVDTQSFFVP